MAFKDNRPGRAYDIGAMGLYPPELFRGLARLKDLHVYSTDGDVMFFSKSLVAMHASSDGLETLVLPESCRVTSLWDGKSLGVLKTLTREMRIGDNALYLVEPVNGANNTAPVR